MVLYSYTDRGRDVKNLPPCKVTIQALYFFDLRRVLVGGTLGPSAGLIFRKAIP